jgi:hypothetical protein
MFIVGDFIEFFTEKRLHSSDIICLLLLLIDLIQFLIICVTIKRFPQYSFHRFLLDSPRSSFPTDSMAQMHLLPTNRSVYFPSK